MEKLFLSMIPQDAKADAKRYIHEKEIPRLFECIMIGVLHHRPSDPVQFVQSCLDYVRSHTAVTLHWNMFVEWDLSPGGSTDPSRSASEMLRPSSDLTASGGGNSWQSLTTPLRAKLAETDEPFLFEEDSGIGSTL